LYVFAGDFALNNPSDLVTPYWNSSSTIQSLPIANGTDVYSPNRAYVLAMQEDSNLVIYDATVVPLTTAAAIWASNQGGGTGPYSLNMQVNFMNFNEI
jgi:hypothetical protein